MRIGFLCTLGDLSPDCFRNAIEEWHELVDLVIVFELKHFAIVALL